MNKSSRFADPSTLGCSVDDVDTASKNVLLFDGDGFSNDCVLWLGCTTSYDGVTVCSATFCREWDVCRSRLHAEVVKLKRRKEFPKRACEYLRHSTFAGEHGRA